MIANGWGPGEAPGSFWGFSILKDEKKLSLRVPRHTEIYII